MSEYNDRPGSVTPMRIVQVCPYAWDSPGGVQTHVQSLSAELTRRGHDLLILAPGRAAATTGLAVSVVGRPVLVPYNGSMAPICPSLRSALRIRAALSAFQPDLVHVHDPFVPSTSMFASWQTRVPIVATFHAYADRSRFFRLGAPFFRLIWNRINLPIAVSAAAVAYVQTHLGVSPLIVPNGVDTRQFACPPRVSNGAHRTVLFVSRLDRRKGFPVVVAAFALLAERMPGLRLVVAGDGIDRAIVDRLAPALRRRITMLGVVPNAELRRHYASADLFVAPALGGESFGIILLEAMAAALPIVASDIPGYREIVRHEGEGLLVPAGAVVPLADAIARVLTEPALAARLGAAGCQRAEHFTWEVIAECVETLYDAASASGRYRLAHLVGSVVHRSVPVRD
jgi:phosphatidylinositol alpha-mannosyltransferase